MATYTTLDFETARELLRPYPLGEVCVFEVIEGGAENSSFRIQTDLGDWCLTVYNKKSFAQVSLLAKIYERLQEEGFPTPEVIRAGEAVVTRFGDRPLIVKTYIQGEVSSHMSEEMCAELGHVLAVLHEIGPPNGLPVQHAYGAASFFAITEATIGDPFREWLSEKARFLASRIPDDLPRVFAHGDAFYDNVIFHQGHLAGLIDFEEAALLPASFDLGMAVLGTCFTGERLEVRKCAALLAGYQARRSLGHAERELLPVMIEYAAVATAFWRFRQYRYMQPEPDLQDHHAEMVARADFVHAMSAAEFLGGEHGSEKAKDA